MRLRATRMSVTGGHTRKRGIDIAALFAGYPGRVGCYYGTKSGPSYTDILARNREALGPELVPVGALQSTTGWALGTGWQIGGGKLVASSASTAVTTVLQVGAQLGKTYVVAWTLSAVSSGSLKVIGSGDFDQPARSVVGPYVDFVQPTGSTGNIGFNPSATFTGEVSSLSVREIVDWQKLVLFDDPNGTVPVFSVFQSSRGRGLLLDSSQGLVRGPEMFGGFGNWTLEDGFSSADGSTLSYTAGTGREAYRSFATTPNAAYEIVYSVDAATVGAALYSVQSQVSSAVYPTLLTGQRRAVLIATGSTMVVRIRVASATGSLSISGMSIRELPGNHMVQPTAAARGELSARYNLLTGTDTLSGWTGSNVSVTPNAVTAPDGSMTASTLLFSGAGYLLSPSASIGAALSGHLSLYIKSMGASLTTVRIQKSDGSERVAINVNFSTGAYNSSGGAASTTDLVDFSPVGGGWYKLTVRGSLNTSTSATIFVSASAAGQDLAVWHPDFRLTADVIQSIPAYQRVTSATDYDDVGFPVYWRGQTDDWAKTRINPSGATKVLVMWAGQKMSDAAAGMLVEHSAVTASNAGSFHLAAPPAAGTANYQFASSGTTRVLVSTASTYPAPSRALLSAVGDISNDVTQVYVGGSLSATSAADQGTGAYLEYDVFLGARAGTSLFANIREFAPPLILFQPTADPGLSSSQIAGLNKAYGRAVGVSL